jgi:hypothetical protein
MQSEFGFVTSTGYLAQNLSGDLYWTLDPNGGNWQNSPNNAFRIAWFADCCQSPGSNNLTTDGTTLTENGIEAEALNTAIGGGSLSVYTNFTGGPSNPGYPSLPNAMGWPR